MTAAPTQTATPTVMKTDLNLQDSDGFYEQLMDAHLGLSAEQSQLLNARLILLLANQVGDAGVLARCIETARSTPDLPPRQ
ncbi:MAG: hypothetical protein RLZ58_2111 [Pseudomonadota bacterium]